MREGGSDSHFNLTEQQSMAENAEHVSVRQENGDKTPDCGHDEPDVLDGGAVSEALQPACQVCTDVSVETVDAEEAGDDALDAHAQGDESVKRKHVVITVTRIGRATDEAEAELPPAEEEDGEEAEKRDVSPDFSTQIQQGTSPNTTLTSALANNPPPGSSVSRATFSPGSPTDKQIQVPALLTSLRVLRKGVFGPEEDTVAHIKPSSQGAKRTIYSEKQGDSKVQGGFLEQISQFLSREKKGEENEERKDVDAEEDLDETREQNEPEESRESPEREESGKDEDTEASSPKAPVSSAEAAFDAFKAFFTPKPLKKDPAAERGDLEAARKRRTEKDVVRAFFERASSKTSEKKESDGKVRTAASDVH